MGKRDHRRRRKRRRVRKTVGHLRQHSFRRAVERYGEVIDIDDAVEQIKANRAAFVRRESNTRTHWDVRQGSRVFRVVYHTKLKMIATVLSQAMVEGDGPEEAQASG
jgi:hypothetical protein